MDKYHKLNIPKRSAGRFKSGVNAKDYYKHYLDSIVPIEALASNKKTIGSYNLKQIEFSSILKDCNKGIVDLIVLESFEFKIPSALGFLSMKQRKLRYILNEDGTLHVKNLSINYIATKDLWMIDDEARVNKTVVYHTNEHTNGKRMSFHYDKGRHVKHLQIYYFKACRNMSRTPARYLKDETKSLTFFEVLTKADRKYKILNIQNNAIR